MPEARGGTGASRSVCFVIEKLAGRGGGAERVVVEVANRLAARGHRVEIVTHQYERGAPFYPLSPEVTLTNLKPPREARPFARRGLDLLRAGVHRIGRLPPPFDRALWHSRHGGFRVRLERHLDAARHDVAVAFMPPAISALARAETKRPLRRIASTHNAPEQDFLNPHRWDPSPLDRKRRLALLERIDVITTLLPEYSAWYAPALQTKCVVLPNPIAPVAGRPAPSERPMRAISVGRLIREKRHHVAIDAWAKLIVERPGWTLDIFGVGPHREKLEERIAALGIGGSVRLRGATSEIGAEYAGAAFLIHASAFEGFPLAVGEALAAGLPVVGFEDCSGLNALVAHERNGLLAPAGNRRADALAGAVARLMDDHALRHGLSEAAPGSVAAYDPEAVLDRWETLLFGAP